MPRFSMVAVLLAASLPRLLAGAGDPVSAFDMESLHYDDECLDGDAPCALNALQLRGARGPDEYIPGLGDLSGDQDVSGGVVETFSELRRAVESAKPGAKIEVLQGATTVFTGTINIERNQDLEIWSHAATLNGQSPSGRERLFYVRGNLTLRGFLLENGKIDYAGAMYFDYRSNGNVRDCNFLNNQATYVGGAIVSKGANLTLYNVNFRKNTADNTCKSKKHCSRRRRNSRKGNAVYVLGKSHLDASMVAQPASEDFYFDHDFEGSATFHCSAPHMKATSPKIANSRVHMSSACDLPPAAKGQQPGL